MWPSTSSPLKPVRRHLFHDSEKSVYVTPSALTPPGKRSASGKPRNVGGLFLGHFVRVCHGIAVHGRLGRPRREQPGQPLLFETPLKVDPATARCVHQFDGIERGVMLPQTAVVHGDVGEAKVGHAAHECLSRARFLRTVIAPARLRAAITLAVLVQ